MATTVRGPIRLSLAVLAWAAIALPVAAAGSVAKDLVAIDTKMKRCIDKNGSNVGMKECTGDALDSADKILNTAYKAIVASLKRKPADESEAKDAKERLDRLVASETAWIKFRDTDCELQGTSMLGGTGEGLVILDCQYAMTAKRVKDLDNLFNDGK